MLEWDELRVEAFLRETRHAEADEAPRNRMVVLAQLERLSGLSPSERSDPLHLLALERALQISAEALFDIGDHVPAGRGRAVPSRDRDVLPALAEAGIIPDAVATRLEGWASPRKLLVHGCADVGPGPPHPERGAGRVPGLDARSRGR